MKLMLKTVPPVVVMMAVVSSLLMAAAPPSQAAIPTTEVRVANEFDAIKRNALSITGSGDARLSGLDTDPLDIRVTGSGDDNVTANQSLTAAVAGSGDIRYGGRATAIRSSVAGSGSISRR